MGDNEQQNEGTQDEVDQAVADATSDTLKLPEEQSGESMADTEGSEGGNQ
ncbi:MAG: hypothetical protein M3P40_04255 [Actinomycetota bacterium]|nr:hypothetical protein [Actinomycetota bacterium]